MTDESKVTNVEAEKIQSCWEIQKHMEPQLSKEVLSADVYV